MNILTLSNCPLVESQGSGYVILNTAKCLENQGHKVDLISPEEIFVLNFLKPRARIYRIMLGMAWWIITHKISKYDLFIFYGAESFLAVFLLKRIMGIKAPIILHSNGLEIMVQDNLKRNNVGTTETKKWYHFDISRFFMYCYKTVDKIITVSKSECDFAINQLGISKDKADFINLGLPEIYFVNQAALRKQNIITYCGGWIPRKGISAMVDAVEVVLRKHKDFHFRLIGVGKDFDKSAIFSIEVVNQIEVIPFVEDKIELMRLYKESSIFLFPSLSESFGLVVPEAMYCECAVISGPTGYAADLVNGEDALILPLPNTANIIEALELLIVNSELREKIALKGKQKASELSWSDFSNKLEKIIKNFNDNA